MSYNDIHNESTPISRPNIPIRQNIQLSVSELFTDLKTFIREEITEGFRRNELKDHFVILNAKESDRDLAELLKKTPDLAHINIRRAETAKQRHEGYLRRQAVRDLQSGDPHCLAAEIKEPSTPIESSRADTRPLIASPQLPVTDVAIADTAQLPTAETPVQAPIDQNQAHNEFMARFMEAFNRNWKEEQPALIESLNKKFG